MAKLNHGNTLQLDEDAAVEEVPSSLNDLQQSLRQLQNSMENLQSSQSCHSIVLEELRSLLLEVKALQRRKTSATPPSKEPDVRPDAPFDLPIMMQLPGAASAAPSSPERRPAAPGAASSTGDAPSSSRSQKKHAVSTLAKVSEELSDILRSSQRSRAESDPVTGGAPPLLSNEDKTEKSRVKASRKGPGKAVSLLELVLPSGPRHPSVAASVEDLEAHMARSLLLPQSSPSSRTAQTLEKPSVSERLSGRDDPNDIDPFAPDDSIAASSRSETPQTYGRTGTLELAKAAAHKPKVKTITLGRLNSSERNEIINSRPRTGLDDIRSANDERARSLAHSNTGSKGFAEYSNILEPWQSPMPFLGRVWLGAIGLLDLTQEGSLQHLRAVWILCLAISLLVLGGFMMWQSVNEILELSTNITTACYMLGVLAGIYSLRRAGVQNLLGSHDGSLETYANLNGFHKAWRLISSQRFKEVLCFLVIMITCRVLVHIPNTGFQQDHLDGLERTIAFCAAAVGYAAIAFTQLHIVAGLELAIDDFSVKFFQQMDLGIAIHEWNVVQATLRQVSMKLSVSLLLLGSSCGMGLLLLAEVAFLRSEEVRGQFSNVQLLLFIAWLAPPLLLFLYVLMRAASVTEKASRVAPLVNSWQFDKSKSVVSASVHWMDFGRQYMVQYILQSEAGFYLQGKRLYIFQVTKLTYYLVAFSMAMLSRFG